jgi:glycosyltransferase involved in cell wall biosynthesis
MNHLTLTIITATHHRADQLARHCLPGILWQTDQEFEWLVINDGKDEPTRQLMAGLKPGVAFTYLEMAHPEIGFGLCQARNLGLTHARSHLIAYCDDDNALHPGFVAATKEFFQEYPQVRCAMVQQNRRRDVMSDGTVVRQGKPFVSPGEQTTVTQLVRQEALFDSNGFTHHRQDAPRWNELYRVFADFEYFLQCLAVWGLDGFKLHKQVLVDYVQSSQGVIGQSSYADWATELQLLLEQYENAGVLSIDDFQALQGLGQQWQQMAERQVAIPAFTD